MVANWAYDCDSETNTQLSAQMSLSLRSKIGSLNAVLLKEKHAVDHEYICQDQIFTQQHYSVVCPCFCDAGLHKWDLWINIIFTMTMHLCTLLNLPRSFFTKTLHCANAIHPYSPNLKTSCDFSFYFNWKFISKRFEDEEDIKRYVTVQLLSITKEKFYKCFNQWKTCWNKCVEWQGKYFEEN